MAEVSSSAMAPRKERPSTVRYRRPTNPLETPSSPGHFLPCPKAVDCVTPLAGLLTCGSYIKANQTATTEPPAHGSLCCTGLSSFFNNIAADCNRTFHLCLCPILCRGDVNKVLDIWYPMDATCLMFLVVSTGIWSGLSAYLCLSFVSLQNLTQRKRLSCTPSLFSTGKQQLPVQVYIYTQSAMYGSSRPCSVNDSPASPFGRSHVVYLLHLQLIRNRLERRITTGLLLGRTPTLDCLQIHLPVHSIFSCTRDTSIYFLSFCPIAASCPQLPRTQKLQAPSCNTLIRRYMVGTIVILN